MGAQVFQLAPGGVLLPGVRGRLGGAGPTPRREASATGLTAESDLPSRPCRYALTP
jgi:hypothetical protein